MQSNEDFEQQALVAWADLPLTRKIYPELEWLFHPANGGLRHISVAAKLKKMGVRKGVPDLCLPVPRGCYTSLWIEMKYGKNKPTPEQLEFKKFIEGQGGFWMVCWDWTEAKRIIEDYLRKGKQQ